ncbi:hypothetical protein RTBOTA2_003917 [Rhodotorula toruloides]|nr:hypothetical protein RTBOTA2_003917 [Rhodotorula toruloides]
MSSPSITLTNASLAQPDHSHAHAEQSQSMHAQSTSPTRSPISPAQPPPLSAPRRVSQRARARSRSPAPATTQSLAALHSPLAPSTAAGATPRSPPGPALASVVTRPSPVVPPSPSVPPTPSLSRPTSPRPPVSRDRSEEPASPSRGRDGASALGAGQTGGLLLSSVEQGGLSKSGSQVDLNHIFERDVEFAPSHHISPSEAVDVAVPPVLTEAAVALSAANDDPSTARDLAALVLDANYDAQAGSGWSSPVVPPGVSLHAWREQQAQQHASPLSQSAYANASRSPNRETTRSFSPDSGSGGRAISPDSSTAFSVGTPPTSAGGGSPPPPASGGPGSLGGSSLPLGPFSQRLAEALENEANKLPQGLVGGMSTVSSKMETPSGSFSSDAASGKPATFTPLKPSLLMPFPSGTPTPGSLSVTDDPFTFSSALSTSPFQSPSTELSHNPLTAASHPGTPLAAPHPRKLSFASYADLVNEERLAEITGERLAADGVSTPAPGGAAGGTGSPTQTRSRSGTRVGAQAPFGLVPPPLTSTASGGGSAAVEQLEKKVAAVALAADRRPSPHSPPALSLFTHSLTHRFRLLATSNMSGSSDPKPAPASVEPPRTIPGLSTSTTPTPSSKPRKRSAKKKDASTPFAGTVEGEATTPSDVPVPVETGAGAGGEDDLVIPEKQTSAVEVVQKRIRSANKKIQRIEGYEASTTALNADQQRAVQGKPVLEAVIRELTELLGVLKAEDAEEETRLKRVAVVEEKKQARAIAAAVQASKDEAQSQLVLLFQFLHLFSLFNPQSAFAPPALPAALANATENDVATVRYLYAQFADGPLLGGRDDAIEKLAKIAEGRDEVVLEELGVTFARIQQLLHGMTAPPQPEIPQEDAGLVTPNEQPAGPADSVVALIDGATEEIHAPPAPSFLQPSEVEQSAAATPPAEEKVQHWAEDLSQAQAPPPSAPATPTTETANTPTTPASQPPPNGHADFAAPPAAPQTQTLDWAADDEGGLPHLPELAPPVPVVSVPSGGAQAAPPLAPAAQQQQTTPSTSSDGFVPARQPRRTGSERGPRGAGGGPHRGGRGRGRGRGELNGERTGSFEGQAAQGGAAGEGRPPRPDRQESGEGRRGSFRGAGRGGPRGGGGRGGRGGRGGAQQGAAGQPTTHPAPAPAA